MKKFEVNTFYQYASLSDLELSPSGKTAAFLERRVREDGDGYTAKLRLMPSDGSQEPVSPVAEDVAMAYWLDETHLLYAPIVKSTSPQKTTSLFVLDLVSKVSSPAAVLPAGAQILGMEDENTCLVTAEIDMAVEAAAAGLSGEAREEALSALAEERSRVTIVDECPFWFNAKGIISGLRRGLYRLHLADGTYEALTDNSFDIERAAFDPKSRTVLLSAFHNMPVHQEKPGLYLYHLTDGSVDCIFKEKERRIVLVEAWNDGYLVSTGNDVPHSAHHTATRAFYFDPHTRKETKLYDDQPYMGNCVIADVRQGGGASIRLVGDELYFIHGHGDASGISVMRKDGGVTPLLDRPGSVDVLDVKNGNILFVAQFDYHLQELYRLDADGQVTQLTHVNDHIWQEYAVVPAERLFFHDKDGVEIHGFVMKPVDFDPNKAYPMILDIHGGPGLSYGETFYHEMQYWASHGYFVAYSNPRGSAARGDEFHNLYGHFGVEDYEDLMQFTDLVLEKYPQIDKARLGVTGGSFGGFMTNWIIGHTNRFAAAASQRSIANHITMHLISDMTGYCTEEMTLYSPWQNLEAVWEQSPLSHAMNAETPTLFLQSEQDYRCPLPEAIQMYTALCIKGVPTRLCMFKNENHELSRNGHPKNRVKRLEEITAWIDKYTAEKSAAGRE